MKSILKSIKPKWVAKILNGEKTIEVRKTAPKDWIDYLSGKTDKKPEPKTVYIYCTKDGDVLWTNVLTDNFYLNLREDHVAPGVEKRNGKVLAKFALREVEVFDDFDDELCDRACLDRGQILDYLGTKLGYAWHISDLVIFDRPKELSEFDSTYPNGIVYVGPCALKGIKYPPQSWCYVEVKE